jgi:hypothetical protein
MMWPTLSMTRSQNWDRKLAAAEGVRLFRFRRGVEKRPVLIQVRPRNVVRRALRYTYDVLLLVVFPDLIDPAHFSSTTSFAGQAISGDLTWRP